MNNFLASMIGQLVEAVSDVSDKAGDLRMEYEDNWPNDALTAELQCFADTEGLLWRAIEVLQAEQARRLTK